jgi:hypothetical protein
VGAYIYYLKNGITWTPHVEAQLIELSELGSELNTVAVQKLLHIKQTFSQTDKKVITSCSTAFNSSSIDGIAQTNSILFAEVQQFLPTDPDLDSVIQCGQNY